MHKLLWTGALLASIFAVISVPATEDRSQGPTVSVAEARLIDQIKEMATPPELSNVPIVEASVALTAPRPALDAGTTLVADASAIDASRRLVVKTEALNLRSSPSKTADILGRLLEGEAVEVAGREGVWVKVATSGGTSGWAYSDYLVEQ